MENLTPEYTPEYFDDNAIDKLPGLLGLKVRKVGRGSMELQLDVEEKHLTINGYLHAGTIVTLADTSACNGCLANLPDRATGFRTIELKCHLIDTIISGRIKCDSRCIHAGDTTQVWESIVRETVTNKLIATFTCTQLILYPREN